MILVRFSATASAQLATRRKWWRENRSKAPDLFERELADAIARLGQSPESLPIFVKLSGHTIRRYLMPKSRCHLYLEIIDASVVVLAAGGGQRKRAPRIRLQDEP